MSNVEYTVDKLKCLICLKQFKRVIKVKDNGNFCWNCLYKRFDLLFHHNEVLNVKYMEDLLYDTRKEVIKKERGKMTPKVRYTILKRDNYKCLMCGKTALEERLDIDHIIPISKGGKTVHENLQTLCRTCNSGKGVDHPNKIYGKK